MNLSKTSINKQRRILRTRSVVSGSADRPRLSVKISNRNVIAQIVDDHAAKTLAYVSTANNKTVQGNLTAKSEWAGSEIAKQAKAKKIKKVVLDRRYKQYHGRIKALAEAARAEGLEF